MPIKYIKVQSVTKLTHNGITILGQ